MKTLNLNQFEEFELTTSEMINIRGGNGMIYMPGPEDDGGNGGVVIVIKI